MSGGQDKEAIEKAVLAAFVANGSQTLRSEQFAKDHKFDAQVIGTSLWVLGLGVGRCSSRVVIACAVFDSCWMVYCDLSLRRRMSCSPQARM